jgi:hypothetical protein
MRLVLNGYVLGRRASEASAEPQAGGRSGPSSVHQSTTIDHGLNVLI